ncbi:MAG: asparagine--tRNA ligase [Chlamydiota bacterium]
MRIKIKNIKHRPDEGRELIGKEQLVKGWIRTARKQKNFTFLEVNDGSTLSNLQVIVNEDTPNYQQLSLDLTTGASVAVTGTIEESPGAKQAVELHATSIEIIGTADASTYPLQKKRHSFEYLRSIAHLRPRTNTIGAIARVSNALSAATHRFFQKKGFLYIQSPIITASDCEGAGEMFQVTTLNIDKIPRTSEENIDYQQDFFSKPAYLTVSGQLNAEIYASALSDVYTFGPTFRAEKSHTSRHLAEFWMIEPEMAFANLKDDMDCAEEFIKYILKAALDDCPEDMELFNHFIDKGVIDRLNHIVETPFERISYSDAIKQLEKAPCKFEYPVQWGADLQSEHERYLTEEVFQKPTIVFDYPKDIKAFYMRLNDDEKTVAAMDVLVPKVGEIIGGSQREERLGVLERRLDELGLDKNAFWWYLELRRYGSVPHAGFGLGFERMVQFATGMENIRDVIPFPRAPGNVEF